MGFVEKGLLIDNKVIEDVFKYRDIDSELSQVYAYFKNSFQRLFESYASLFNIKDCCFYIQNNNTCNAFALKRKGYNINEGVFYVPSNLDLGEFLLGVFYVRKSRTIWQQ
jgi:hypothetical protein